MSCDILHTQVHMLCQLCDSWFVDQHFLLHHDPFIKVCGGWDQQIFPLLFKLCLFFAQPTTQNKHVSNCLLLLLRSNRQMYTTGSEAFFCHTTFTRCLTLPVDEIAYLYQVKKLAFGTGNVHHPVHTHRIFQWLVKPLHTVQCTRNKQPGCRVCFLFFSATTAIGCPAE